MRPKTTFLSAATRSVLAGPAAALLVLAAGGAAPAHELVEFKEDVKPILSTSCGGTLCHQSQNTSGVELTSYETIMASVGVQYGGPVVVAGQPEESPLIDKISNTRPHFGERMPFQLEPLTEGQIAVIVRWIQEGARESHHRVRGDSNGDDAIELVDVVFTLLYLFQAGDPPSCPALADADSDGEVKLADVVFVLNYLFLAGPEPQELTEDEEAACEASGELSFSNIYEQVFAQSCAFTSCHSIAYHKGGLSLESPEVAYSQLVGVAPVNEAALAGGLLRVDPGQPDRSFILRKLTVPGPGEGNRMPANSSSGLSATAIAAIREWILAGAPREGTVHGVPALGNEVPPPIGDMPVPPKPENGIQLRMQPFSIGPGNEREVFYFIGQPFAALPADPIIQRIDIHMREESHHFILYEYIGQTNPSPGIRGDALSVDLLNTHRYTVASQQSFFSLSFPTGVGLKFARTARFDLNSHYLNLNGKGTLLGEVYVNIFFAEPGSVTTFVKPIFDINPVINVPPHQTATTAWSFPGFTSAQFDPQIGNLGRLARRTEIYSLSSHMHRHGTRFSMFLMQNGQVVSPRQMIYDNLDWDDPVYKVFNPPLVLSAGQGLRFETTHSYYDPPSDSSPALTFGPTSEDEMAIMLGYYALK